MAPMSRVRHALPVLVAGLLALTAAGCAGQTSSKSSAEDFTGVKKDVAQVVEDLQSAVSKADGKKVCNEILAKPLSSSVSKGGKTCKDILDDNLSDVDTSGMKVTSVTVTGDTAKAVVVSDGGSGDPDRTNTFTLVKDTGANGVWKISSFG